MNDVTVVIPMYNAAPTILRALQSVLAQTTPPRRIVVADDCSTDNSADVVRAANLPTVEMVRTERNGGIAVARNRGAREASTTWLAFIDADDRWEPEFLERTLAAIERFGCDFGSAGGTRERPDGSSRHVQVRSVPGAGDALDLTKDFWRVAMRFRPVHASAVVVRRSLFEDVGGFWERMRTGEDTCLWVNLWLRGRFVFVNLPLVESAVVETGVSAQGLSYHALLLSATCMLAGLARAVRARRPGTRWFVVFAARRLINLHTRWLLGTLRRRGRRPAARAPGA